MKIKLLIVALIIATGTLLLNVIFSSSVTASSSGAPAGNTGSPGDGSNCSTSGCHSDQGAASPASNSFGFITTNIPAAGYTPGTTYTVTALATVGGPAINTKIGFQLSPQNVAGTQKGTLVVTNPASTQLVGGGKYITHTFAGTAVSGTSKSWVFNWTAPATGQGPVTFYAAFLYSNSNNTNFGDSVVTTSHTVNEIGTIGVNELQKDDNAWSVYPNPSFNTIQIKNSLLNEGKFDVLIFDVTGRKVKEIKEYNILIKPVIDISDLVNGIYLVNINTENGSVDKKIIKK